MQSWSQVALSILFTGTCHKENTNSSHKTNLDKCRGNMQPVLPSDPFDLCRHAGKNHKWWLNTDNATPLQNEAA